MHVEAPDSYARILAAVSSPAHQARRAGRPFVIAVDGRDGAGKSSLASWLAWQLQCATVHLDLLLKPARGRRFRGWRIRDLRLALAGRIRRGRTTIIEGVMIEDALELAGLSADYRILVRRTDDDMVMRDDGPTSLFAMEIRPYLARMASIRSADFTVEWAIPEPD